MANAKQVQSVLPRFGTWNVNEDVSYSVIFENARANKGGGTDRLNEHFEYPYLSRTHATKKGGNTVYSHYEPENCTLSLGSLGQMEIKNYSAHNQRTINTVEDAWDTQPFHLYHAEIARKDSGYSYVNSFDSSIPEVTSLYAESRGSQHLYQSKLNSSQSSSNSHFERQARDSSRGTHEKSRGPHDIAKRSYLHHETIESSYQNHCGRSHSKANSSDRETNSLDDLPSKHLSSTAARRSRRVVGSNKGGKTMPKFGDWDVNDPASAEEFTVIFDKAHKERTFRAIQCQPKSCVGVDEDLYKPATCQKSSTGLRHLLCCSSSSP